jgi:uracil-DNA glycosylase
LNVPVEPGLFGDAGVPDRLRAWDPASWPVAAGWQTLIRVFLQTPQAAALGRFVEKRLEDGAVVFPPQPFRALALTPLERVKVVILGQDPYHGAGQAHGLAFSVQEGVKIPPSLRNIFKELARDPALQLAPPRSGSLERWAEQGVLLLNTCLTVEEGLPASHARQGWELLTDAVIRTVGERPEPAVFLLWGAHAQAKQALIDQSRHLVLMANHPSPLSALRPPQPFIGCGHFSRANAWLQDLHIKAVAW